MTRHSEDKTEEFYEARAEEYAARTGHLSMASLYAPFLELVPPGGHILDAGCGPGRDAAEFARRGYQVTACDGSARMVELTRRRTGVHAIQARFQDFQFHRQFDGIWACASLLHVPLPELDDALARLRNAMKVGGAGFVSFKRGEGERIEEGRRFIDFTPESLSARLRGISGLAVIRTWVSRDEQGRIHVQWVNALVRAEV